MGGGFTTIPTEIVLWEVVSPLYLPRSFCGRWFDCYTYRDRFVGGGLTVVLSLSFTLLSFFSIFSVFFC